LDAASLLQLETLVAEYPFCSTIRMLLAKNHKALNTPDNLKIIKDNAIFVPDRKRYFDFIHNITHDVIIPSLTPVYSIETAGEIQENGLDEISENVEAHDDLVDKFIREQPRIHSIPKEDITDEEDLPSPKEMEQEFVSEILAEIYWKQGNHDRAISIFEKLSLRIPEKSSYFATQIEKIKGEIIKKI
jgi:hypothetical protein